MPNRIQKCPRFDELILPIFQALKKYNVKYNNGDDFDGVVVTPNNVDLIVDSGAKLIAKAINKRIEKIEKL